MSDVDSPGPVRCLVIVADDNPVNRAIAVQMLAACGFAAEEAVSGRDCIERCIALRPDAVLMDVNMPDTDGLEATRILRRMQAQSELPRFPIIAASASFADADEARCRAAGMDGYLEKPLNLATLGPAIRSLIERCAGLLC
jgi:CheY-like chemotaxis protein